MTERKTLYWKEEPTTIGVFETSEDEEMVYVKKIFSFIFYPIIKLIDHIKYKKKIKELQKRDPFIYK